MPLALELGKLFSFRGPAATTLHRSPWGRSTPAALTVWLRVETKQRWNIPGHAGGQGYEPPPPRPSDPIVS